MAFSAARDPDLGSRNTEQLYVLDLDDLHVRQLATFDGPNSRPQWSPDGKQIAFETSGGQAMFYYANSQIAVVPAGGGSPRILTKAFDEDANLIDWGEDGIYFSALQKTSGHLFRLNPSTGAPSRISEPDRFYIAGASFTKDHRTIAGVGAMPNQFSEVFVSPVDEFAAKPLTNMAEQWKDFRIATREVVEWKSTDGTPIEGVLIKPADYDPTRKYPLLVVIHGGPTGIDLPTRGADRYYPIERGDQDKRVPPPNSYELYQALKDRGVPVKLVFFKGFGHQINKPKQQRALMDQNYEWFSKYIWGEEIQNSGQ
jgi:dipeptidyl aminopeptidase/acylaminoacyl peptidase